jgi:hypothetical protein
MTGTNVVTSHDNILTGQRLPVVLRHIPNRDEIPGLLTVTIHRHRQTALEPIGEDRQHAEVRRTGILAWSVNVEGSIWIPDS